MVELEVILTSDPVNGEITEVIAKNGQYYHKAYKVTGQGEVSLKMALLKIPELLNAVQGGG